MIIWARLRDRRPDTELAVINAHFDHQFERSRVKSAQAMVDLVGGGELDGLATLVSGDHNAPAMTVAAHTPVQALVSRA